MFARPLAVILATAAMLLSNNPILASADECGPTSLTTVMAKMDSGPSSMPSYSATIKVYGKMHYFPYFGMSFNGTSLYTRPGNYAVTLPNAPGDAARIPTLVHDMSADTTSSNHWNTYDIAASCPAAGRLLVDLSPKTAGDTKHIQLTVDIETAHVTKAIFLRTDGTITMNQQFGPIAGHDVILHQQYTVLLSSRAKGDVTVEYQNVNVATSVAGL